MLILTYFILTRKFVNSSSKLSLPTENVSAYSGPRTPVLNNAMMEINTRKTEIMGKLSPTGGGFRGFMEQVTSE